MPLTIPTVPSKSGCESESTEKLLKKSIADSWASLLEILLH